TVRLLAGLPSELVVVSTLNTPFETVISASAGSTLTPTSENWLFPTFVKLNAPLPVLRLAAPPRMSQRPLPPNVVWLDNDTFPNALMLSAPLLKIAPLLLTPAPETMMGSPVRVWPPTSSVAPLLMVVIPSARPRALALPALSVPWTTVTAPVKVLAPLRVSTPLL